MYHSPTSLADALAIKSRLGLRASVIAGGTDLVVGVRKGRRRIEELLDVSRVAVLDAVTEVGDCLRFGAACTHASNARG